MSDTKTKIGDFLAKREGGGSGSGGGTATATRPAQTAAKEGDLSDTTPWGVAAHEIEGEEWDLGLHLVRIAESGHYTKKGETASTSIKVKFLGLAGSMKGSYYTDYWPKSGAGLKKTKKACKAVGLVNESGDIALPGGVAQLVGRDLVIEITRQSEKFRDKESGEETTRQVNKIDFLGYHAVGSVELPAEGDPFAEGITLKEGQQTVTVQTEAGPVTADAATGEVVGVEAGAVPPF